MGERQLVALARTALAGPDLLVLDEATSGVDPATDVTIQRALAAIQDADLLIVATPALFGLTATGPELLDPAATAGEYSALLIA